MKIIAPTMEAAEKLYERFSKLSGNFEYHGEEGRRFFYHSFFHSHLIILFDFGMVRVTDYIPKQSVRVHGLFDSKEVLRGQEEMVLAAKEIFALFHIERIEVIVPENKKSVVKLMEKLPFAYEGTLRRAIPDGIIYQNGRMYSIIKEDIGYE